MFKILTARFRKYLASISSGKTDQSSDDVKRTCQPCEISSNGNCEAVCSANTDKGADANAPIERNALLREATVIGDIDAVRILIEHGADPNAGNQDGRTPLLEASLGGHIDLTHLLIEHGANPNVCDKFGRTPLHEASRSLGVVRLLIEHGADTNALDVGGWTPLHWASGCGNLDVVRLLVEHGADPTIGHEDGRTPLDWANHGGHITVVHYLRSKMP